MSLRKLHHYERLVTCVDKRHTTLSDGYSQNSKKMIILIKAGLGGLKLRVSVSDCV